MTTLAVEIISSIGGDKRWKMTTRRGMRRARELDILKVFLKINSVCVVFVLRMGNMIEERV